MIPHGHELVLASASPRRREILRQAGYSFTLHPSKVSENLEENLRAKLSIDEQIMEIARRKARAVVEEFAEKAEKPFITLAADTLVILDGEVLGKPADAADAIRTLEKLSGRWHEVKTAVVLVRHGGAREPRSQIETAGIETTRVLFKNLTARQIADYVASGDPMDKAGSYGIQNLDESFVARLEGRLDNVIGLSLRLFTSLLRQLTPAP